MNEFFPKKRGMRDEIFFKLFTKKKKKASKVEFFFVEKCEKCDAGEGLHN